ncbi:hypothetical protein [Streptomyces sp. NBC_01637]|uniref:hypothetical protein n=1 Tax=unclassified Streptomyces TaxID=2593676 RepID=UPI00386F8574|nr:hypothetical protein OH719_32225 [Streptomyces sp. NBC_01653]WTD88748.1 hypothetical protein OG891_14645 [Streptomyces sp. NBC_01637]
MSQDKSASREPDPFFDAVGRVTVAGTAMDASLHNLLSAVALEPTLIMYTNAANTSQLIELCRLALTVGTVTSEDVTEIEACLKRADALRIRRNDIVHSLHMWEEAGDGIEAMKPIRKNLGYKTTPITIEAMRALAEEIHTLRGEIFRVGWNANAGRMPGMGGLIPPQDTEKGSETTGNT